MAENAPQRWFITGISTGFGREIARAALRAGDRVIGTVRQADQTIGLQAEGIDAIVMDVNDQSQVDAAVRDVEARMAGVDVVVNNAGFGLIGAIEALDIEEIRAVMETNFFGVLRVTKAFIPELRSHGGVFVNVSSVAGQVGMSSAGGYCASKFALEGFSEALAEELEPFGVKVLIVEPGAFRTDFSGRSIRTAEASVDVYSGTQAGDVKAMLKQYHGNEPGDPVKAAEAIVAAVKSDTMPLRLALGADAVARIAAKLDRSREDLDSWREFSIATAFAP